MLRIVYPPDGVRVPALPETFVYGYADPRGRLFINVQEVDNHPEGGNLAMIPLSGVVQPGIRRQSFRSIVVVFSFSLVIKLINMIIYRSKTLSRNRGRRSP